MNELKKDEIVINIHPEDRKLEHVILPEFIGEKKEIKNDWTEDIVEYVNKIGETCQKYKKLHMEKSKNYIKKYNSVMYTSIILGPFVGMLSAININLNDTQIIPIIILCISFLNGIMVSIIKFRRWDEISLSHKASAAKYSALSTNTKHQLTLKEKDREDSDDYLRWLTNAFNSLFLSSPIISNEVQDEFENLTSVKIRKNIIGETVIDHSGDGRLNYELKRFLNSN